MSVLEIPASFKKAAAAPVLTLSPSTGSPNTTAIRQVLSEFALARSPGAIAHGRLAQYPATATLEERLYDARAACKIRIATVSMHLDHDWRIRLFRQLDNLMDIDNWEKDDLPVTDASFNTLLRMLLFIRPKRRPGVGITNDGNIIAAWTAGKNRLTIECRGADQIRWVVVIYDGEERESAAGEAYLPRLMDVLAPYKPQRWFADEESKVAAW
jgi:hypothetical protein